MILSLIQTVREIKTKICGLLFSSLLIWQRFFCLSKWFHNGLDPAKFALLSYPFPDCHSFSYLCAASSIYMLTWWTGLGNWSGWEVNPFSVAPNLVGSFSARSVLPCDCANVIAVTKGRDEGSESVGKRKVRTMLSVSSVDIYRLNWWWNSSVASWLLEL